jgi:E3 ubiquitin-protein ligase RNF115/126
MMAQYLMALLGAQRLGGMRGGGSLGGDPYAELLFGGLGAHEGEGGNGRWGDYVFNQEGKGFAYRNKPDKPVI